MPDTSSKAPGDETDQPVTSPPARREPLSPWVLLILGGIVALGWTGLFVSGPHTGWAQALYHSIGLLNHDSGWAYDKETGTPSLLFRVLTVIAPLFTAATVIYIITDWAGPTLVRLSAFGRLSFGNSRGVALIGLNENSFALACALRARPDAKGRRFVPLIFTEDRDSALALRCRRSWIPTYSRHAGGLWAFCNRLRYVHGPKGGRGLTRIIDSTQDLISFLPDAGAQIDVLTELRRWRPRGKSAARAWVLLDDRGFAQRLDEAFNGVPKGAVVPRLLTLETLAARQLLLSHQFDVLADSFGQERIHLVIYGFGAAGRAIAKEAAQLYVTRPSLARATAKLRITAFDLHGPAARDALLAEDPGLASVVDLHVHTMRIPPAGLLERQLHRLPPDATGHVAAFGDARRCVSLAISLRRWLLEPPPGLDEAWRLAHQAVPIFVRIASWRGLGRLFDKPQGQGKPARRTGRAERYWPPDGIFDFGAVEAIFGSPDQSPSQRGPVLDQQSENGARAIHAAYIHTRRQGSPDPALQAKRTGEMEWHLLSPQLRESNFRAYDHIAIKARAAGCRFVAGRKDASQDVSALHHHAGLLSQLEHRRYMAERLANGWRLAGHRLDAVGVHPDLVDWNVLEPAERALDDAQINALPDIARAAGHHLANALLIGVVGHRAGGIPPERVRIPKERVSSVTRRLHAQLDALRKRGSAPLLLTALASGTDSWAAEIARDLHIPYLAVLPLPYEILREDFPDRASLERFHKLAAAAELRIELPMTFGRASEMTRNPQPPETDNLKKRAQQYALAGAYIVERANVLIAVSDGHPSEDVGGPADVLQWWTNGVPPHFQTPANFFPRPANPSAAIIIDPNGESVGHGDKPVRHNSQPQP